MQEWVTNLDDFGEMNLYAPCILECAHMVIRYH